MTLTDRRARYATFTAGARIFALIVLAPPVALSQDYDIIVTVMLLAAVWMCAIFADGIRQIPAMPALVLESSFVTFLACLALETSGVLLPAIVIPPLIGGLVRGTRGAFEVLGAQVTICWATIFPSTVIAFTPAISSALFTWLMAGLGLGLMAAFVHRSRGETSTTATSYRDARTLLTRLQELSGDLVGGLDPVSISRTILDLSREELPLTGAVVYAPTTGGFTPLLEGDVTDEGADNAHVLTLAFQTGESVIDDPWIAVPLVTDAGVVAVLAGGLLPTSRLSTAELRRALSNLSEQLRPEALQLDTALLFASVRDDAMTEERRRLARDLHDGVAQDLASLGYVVDDLAATADSPEFAERCHDLRAELTRVVADLRRSVFLLRSDTHGAVSLGESIRALAGHIESRSGIAVKVELDEGSKRLRSDVESELLRIAQEGINNAVKHSRASLIRVDVWVRAPEAVITVVDNGRGLQPGRDDSHGIRIMRERARRIGAALDLHNIEGQPGTALRVVLGSATRSEGPGRELEGMLHD